jgi:hypothetical protein
LHYLRDIDVVLKQFPELYKKYKRVSESYNVEYDPVYDMDAVDLRNYIYELRDSVDVLSLQLKETKTQLAVCEGNDGRLSKIFHILKTRKIDCFMYTRLGSDSLKKEIDEVHKSSRKLYQAIKSVNPEEAKILLR